MRLKAKEIRTKVRKRLRTAQKRFALGWRVPLSEDEAKVWIASAGTRGGVTGSSAADDFTRKYLVGDVACLVLACKDLLEDAYGQALKLRVGRVRQQRPSRKDTGVPWKEGQYLLHAAIMLDDACLADVRLDWALAKTMGLGEGRRPMAKFMAAARAMQRGSGPASSSPGARGREEILPFDPSYGAPRWMGLSPQQVSIAGQRVGGKLHANFQAGAVPKVGDVVRAGNGATGIVEQVEVNMGPRGQHDVTVTVRDVTPAQGLGFDMGQAAKGDHADLVIRDDVVATMDGEPVLPGGDDDAV